MKTILHLCLAAVVMAACNTAQPAAKETDTLTVEHVSTDPAEQEPVEAGTEAAQPLAGPVVVHFRNDLLVFSCRLTEPIVNQTDPDTVFVSPGELGETLAGATLKIKSDSLASLVVEQSYETVSGISNEGPICLLENWKHYRSDWVQLEGGYGEYNGDYFCKEYSQEEDARFPDVDITEWKKEVERSCGKDYLELVKNNTTLTGDAAFVTIHKIYFRITGKKKDGSTVTKYIVFYPSIGC
ncbi:hypothetical protein [Chitinophaga sp. 22620]|uniref:hypothetical protein n=1 Tax=Chitinophaga sp. 22620 TaxID=3453952 RepID=UPI003F877EFC